MNSKFPLHRRTLLRGLGVSLALPCLDAMRTAQAASASVANPTPIRMAWVFFPNGTNAARWLPEGEGRDWKVSSSLEPLAELRDDFLVLRGLAQRNAASLGDGPGDHARSAAAFLTGAHPFKTAGSKIRVGRSVDQVAADVYGRQTRLPSIELGTEEGRSAGSCDSGYACAYSNNISWRTETQPMAKEINPRMAFERLFGGTSKQATEAEERQALKKSILDMVADSTKRLQSKVGSEDRRKLDEYFTSVREIELRLERMNQKVDVSAYGATAPKEDTSDYGEHIRIMYDLMVLAFRTDTTRLATFMLANEGSNKTFPMIDVKEGHHALSHHQEKQDAIEKIAKIDRYYSEQFAYFLRKLKETPDGDGNLLDHSMIVYGGAIGDGNRHNHDDLPLLLAGRAGGHVTPGRLVRYDNLPLNNLFLNMLDIAGVSIDRLGDSTGRLPGLKA
ncbi:MAG: DUF1552 domain-containing protein [Pirellulales bacterium]